MDDAMRWDDGELEGALARYERLLDESGLAPLTVHSYVDYTDRFLRWRKGDYLPRGVAFRGRPVPRTPVDLRQLREQLEQYQVLLRNSGLRPMAVHTYVDEAARFVRWLGGEYAVPAPGGARRPQQPLTAATRPAAVDVVERPWYWEGRVQDGLLEYLRVEGWEILSTTDAERRERGVDVLARRGRRTMAVEVKGYPGPTRERGPRRGEEKVAHPSAQAVHYLGDALFTVTRWPDVFPERAIALAMPDVPRYRNLVAQRRTALQRLGVAVYLIGEGGGVTEVIAPPA